MVNIADREELLAYLEKSELIQNKADVQIHYYGGGVSGTVALVTEGDSCLIVKQALAALKVAADWRCDQSRMRVEYEAQKTYAEIVPDQVPRAIRFDSKNYIMIREAAPTTARMWKSDLLNGKLDFQMARQAIEALVAVHNRTAGDNTVKEIFSDSQFFYGLRIEPYIEYTASLHPKLQEKAKQVVDMLMSEKIALIHGDYSPKNIMVDGNNLYILDLEVAYYGHPAFDLAFFSNHFLLKSVKNKQWTDAYLNMLSYMLNIYFQRITYREPHLLERETVQILGFLFLARVDGKSPVEYLTDEADRELVRQAACRILEENMSTLGAVIELIRSCVKRSLRINEE